MRYLNVLERAIFLVFGILFICLGGCDRVRDMGPKDTLAFVPVRVSVVYPGDSGLKTQTG